MITPSAVTLRARWRVMVAGNPKIPAHVKVWALCLADEATPGVWHHETGRNLHAWRQRDAAEFLDVSVRQVKRTTAVAVQLGIVSRHRAGGRLRLGSGAVALHLVGAGLRGCSECVEVPGNDLRTLVNGTCKGPLATHNPGNPSSQRLRGRRRSPRGPRDSLIRDLGLPEFRAAKGTSAYKEQPHPGEDRVPRNRRANPRGLGPVRRRCAFHPDDEMALDHPTVNPATSSLPVTRGVRS